MSKRLASLIQLGSAVKFVNSRTTAKWIPLSASLSCDGNACFSTFTPKLLDASETLTLKRTNVRCFHLSRPVAAAEDGSEVKGDEYVSDTPVLDSLKARGLYPDELYQHYRHLLIETIQISPDGKSVDIGWSDGHKSLFHAIWLRHFCHCPQCKLDHHGMATVDFQKVGPECVVKSFHIEGDEVALIKWVSNEGEHEGHLPVAYLRSNCYSKEALDQRSQARAMTFATDTIIPELDFEEVSSSERGLFKWIVALSDKGICLLKNVPTDNYYVKKVGEMIAPIQHTIYGELFDVISTKEPINAAYSNVRLLPHMDQINYESPPGIQLLHCVKFDESIVGGENNFLDIHQLAHKFREETPEYFDALARIPFTSQMVNYRSDFQVHLQIQRPIFMLNHRKELVSVNWHPMLIGALQIPAEDVDLFYKAYIAFYRKVVATPNTYQLRLTPGDLISFNNRRILHARTAFVNHDGERHLQGTYVEASEFQSLAQVLHNRLGDGRLAMRNGSNNWF